MTAAGMHRETGKPVEGLAYLQQRLRDVLTTPKGSLVGHREFGSRLHELSDRNVDRGFQMQAYIRIAEAIANPANGLADLRLDKVYVESAGDGHTVLWGEGYLVANGEPVSFEGLVL